MQIDNDVVHTVNFFQTAFMIVLSLSLGEALKSFASDNQNHPLYWDRAPALLAFLLVFFPFFQSMSQYLYVTYLNPRTALEFYPGYLVFDGLMFTLEAGCFFVMSRSLAPRIWRRFYASTLTLMAIDIGWTSVNFFRGVHVGDWLWLDIVVVVALLTLIWFERGRPPSMRPSYVGLAIVAVTTALSYWLERDIYFPLNETKAVLNPHQETPMRNETTVPVQHVKIVLAQPFDTARAAFEAILPKLNTESISLLEAGDVDRARQLLELGPELSIFQSRDHGRVLQIAGLARKAIQYDVGNPLTASKMTRHQLPAALYAPFRVVLYEDAQGRAVFEYDKPSSLFGQFGDADVRAVALGLDVAIDAALRRVGH